MATILVLGGVAALHGIPVLSAYSSLMSGRAVRTGAQPSVQALPASPPSSQVEIKGSASAGDRKLYTRVAQVLGRESPDGEPDSTPGRDGDEQSRPITYRTLCVRLCDGYYFPISFAAPRARLARDARACESRCGTGARLFVYRNPGGDLMEMSDLDGAPYSKLPTALLYRTKYIPSCKCQPHPWEAQSLQRHKRYALVAAARAGNTSAAKKLQAQSGDKPAARKADLGDRRKPERSAAYARSKVAASADADWSEADMMRLGRKRGRGTSRDQRGTFADSDWRKRVFQDY